MGWETLIPIIAQYGIPLAEQLWQKWSTGSAPTQADWDQLKALAQGSAQSQMLAALARAGIDPNSDQGKALLALTPKAH